MPIWGRCALNVGISLVGLDNLAATLRISRRFDIKVKQRGYHKGGLMIKKVADFKKKGGLVLDGERSFHINQGMNNGAYKLEDLEDTKISGTWNVISLEFYPN